MSAAKKTAKGAAALLLLDIGVKLTLMAGAAFAATQSLRALAAHRKGKKK